ncbi:MAG: YIP1 family protein [Acidobacteria bacterium]|nr:YIP1 family protein [Acidobacteriota bacterium]
MNEENQDLIEQNNVEWQAPPIPEEIVNTEEPAQMSEVGTLGNIFFEPGKTFEDLRRKPRFILATLIFILLSTVFSFLFVNKVGEEGFRRFAQEQVEKNPSTQSLTPEQKQKSIELNLTIIKTIKYLVPLFIIIFFALGGLIYWLGVKAMGGSANYWQSVSVWVYASFAPGVVAMVANLLILFFKSADEIDIAASQRGLVQANPSFFVDGKQNPVLATFLGTFDFFEIWGWILAAIGLRIVGKISTSTAWAIVLIVALIGVAFRVVSALFS